MMLCSLCAAPSGTAFRVPAVVGSGGMHLIRKGMSCDHHLVRQLASSSFLKQAIRAPAFGQGPLLQTAKREDRDDDVSSRHMRCAVTGADMSLVTCRMTHCWWILRNQLSRA